ncbi:MAG TPA: GIY-YIG nuclease family protein [Roseococcus sp.]|nr:GIY-YIG nuclease family protein [Roseococcus sp.]
MTLHLPDIWPIAAPEAHKLHFARWNQESQPLEVWARSRAEWQSWQEYRPARDDFNRPFIFALMQFYHEPDAWLFGGVFRVLARHADRYAVELTDQGAGFIGRLKLGSTWRNRSTRVNFENHYAGLEVLELLREPYAGRAFPGFEEIDLGFEELETLVRNARPDWKAPLASVKGIYLITDVVTGRRYVGAALGEGGIWSRWCDYVATGHGGNVELRELAPDPSLTYIRHAFRFALLEHRPVGTADDVILRREAHWKRILLTRGAFGLNRN